MSSDIPEADREGELAHPREVYDLFGHEREARAMEEALSTGHMHHAWMVTGAKGVGKATLAYRLARRALGAQASGEGALASSPGDPVCRQLEGLAHPDFLLIRRPYNDKTKKLKGEITVDEARKAADFFSKSASGDHWRVVIVDTADELNINASNALLKTLEEPPKKGLLILLVETPGRLLPTIRSRCRRLSLRAPDVSATADWLVERHDIERSVADRAADLATGAPGRALAHAVSGEIGVKDDLDQMLTGLPRIDRSAAIRLADKASRKDGEATKRAIMRFLQAYAQDRARELAVAEAGLSKAAAWVKASDELRRLARDADAIYLDPKQTVHAAISLVEAAASQS
ncbi:DNA polymerase III subunit delta' [Maricaulaceae bacterium EIL42A08]|nr:DNA polymerase III subunit delta' [Maricaulaceae bacterium EIL42A08]